MEFRFATRLSDLLAGGLAVALAGACTLFAGTMIVRLNNMEDPPADLGLNFPGAAERRTAVRAVRVDDDLVTGSTDRPDGGGPPQQPYRDETPVLDYRLLAVIDGIAFVEVTDIKGRKIVPVRRGSRLPGAAPVERLEKVDGRWQLTAGHVFLVQ
jgi:hypothetical protein